MYLIIIIKFNVSWQTLDSVDYSLFFHDVKICAHDKLCSLSDLKWWTELKIRHSKMFSGLNIYWTFNLCQKIKNLNQNNLFVNSLHTFTDIFPHKIWVLFIISFNASLWGLSLICILVCIHRAEQFRNINEGAGLKVSRCSSDISQEMWLFKPKWIDKV